MHVARASQGLEFVQSCVFIFLLRSFERQ